MADNTGRNIKEEEEFLELQKQIKAAAKDAGKSLSNAGDYTKVILANYIEMQRVSAKIRETEKEIARLEKDSSEAAQQRAAFLRQEVAELKKERDEIKAINKEMRSLTNVARAGLSGIISYIGQAITGYFDFNQKIRDSAAQIGLSSKNMNMLQSNIEQASVQMARYGVLSTDAVAAQQAYSDEVGRSVILSTQALENMAMIGKATGLGMEGMASLTAEMEAFGLGAEDSAKFIYEMSSETSAMGLNSAKVIKKFQENLGLLNSLSFKNGREGLKKMVQLSEKYKINMNDIANASQKAFSPEGAIEMAANLQVMGGAMAGLADPFQLMYKARNNPEKFAEDMAQAAAQSAVFNKQTGDFEVSAMEMDRLRVVAEATGQSMENLVATAKRTAKMNMFEQMLSGKGLKAEEREAIATMTDMVDGKAMIQVGFTKDGKSDLRELSSLTKDELQKVMNDKKTAKEAAEQATGFMERLQNFLNQLMQAIYPLFHSLEQYFQPMIEALTEKTTGWAEDLKNFFTNFDFSGFVDGIVSFFKGLWTAIKWLADHWIAALLIAGSIMVAPWLASQVAAGRIFGMSARSAMGVPGMGGGAAGGGMTGAQAAMQGQAAKATGMGNMMQSLGSAAKILAVAGALWIMSEALINFNKVEWSSLAKAGVAMIGFGLALEMLGPILDSFSAEAAIAIPVMLGLGAAVVLLGAGLFLMGQVPIANLIVGMLGLIGVIMAFSSLSLTGVGWFGIGLLLAFGAAMLMIGAAVYVASMGLNMIKDNIMEMGVGLFLAGAGFLAMAAGIGVLTVSLIALGLASFLALPGLLMLGAVSGMLVATASSLNAVGGGEGLTKSINAINSVNESKLEALKDLSMWMALIGASPTIKFDESLTIDGSIEIAGAAGGKTNTDWIKDPIFVSQLKEMIAEATAKDRNGGT